MSKPSTFTDPNLTKGTFLLLEDMPQIREQMVKDLRDLGITGTIIEADCVKKAIEAMNTHKFNFIISDWNLPDGTGYDFLVKLRSVLAFKSIPFIMCTTMDEVKYILDAIKAGANEYVVKPWTIEELKKKIGDTWDKSQKPK